MHYLAIATLLYLAAATVYLARLRPDYSHIRHTISELGEHGCPIERQVAFGVFLPVGLAMACVAFVERANEPAALLAAALSVGYIGSAFFPIDADAPMSGTWRNGAHSLAAGFSYVGAIAAFELIGRDVGLPYTAAKFAIIAFFVTVYVPGLRELRGLLQRIVEVGLFAGLAFMIQQAQT